MELRLLDLRNCCLKPLSTFLNQPKTHDFVRSHKFYIGFHIRNLQLIGSGWYRFHVVHYGQLLDETGHVASTLVEDATTNSHQEPFASRAKS